MSRLLATILSATLYAASFPPLSLAPLAWVALVPFLVVISSMRPGPAAAWGLLLGLVGAYGLAWWLPGMVASYFEVSSVVGLGVFFAAATVLAATYCALFASWVAWLALRGCASPLVVAAGWTALEFARANLLGGNPWGLVAYSQVGWPRLMQIADVAGPYGVGLLVLLSNGCLASVVAPRLRARRPVLSFVGLALLLLTTLAYGTWRLAQPLATGEEISVAVVQDAVARDVRRHADVRAAALDRYLALTREGMSARPALVFWPENAVDFHVQDPSAERDRLLGSIRELGPDLILGGPAYTLGAVGPQRYNSVFLVRQGHVAGRYDKMILLPFAERGTGAALDAGRRFSALRSGVGLVGTFVCFEAMYPALVRRLAANGAEVLANLSNDAWFDHEAPAQHHLDIASVRAIENRRYLVRSTTTGFSAVIDPHGQVVGRTHLGGVEVLARPIRRSRIRTMYQWWGDVPAWLTAAAAIGGSLRRRRPAAGPTHEGGNSR
jgi:apolipoprotein N-acyltransferase